MSVSAVSIDEQPVIDHQRKWRMLVLLSLAEMLAMAVWFSASAVVPALTDVWNLTDGGKSWLTMSVQIGFVVGAFGSAVFTLADRIPSKWFFTVSTFLAAFFTVLIPLAADGLTTALILRFLTGLVMAGVYPVGMKIMATWTMKERGLGIGLMVGALAVGNAFPHLLRAFSDLERWEPVLYLAAGTAAIGGIIGLIFIEEGPYRSQSPKFEWHHIRDIMQERSVLLANLGYLGHMWELYAMWSWIAAFLLASFEATGHGARAASLVAFGVIAIGSVGSYVAGMMADKIGRTTVTIASMALSGTIALIIGQFYGNSPVIVSILALIWGFSIVADSAQFSASVTELADKRLVGTALTVQTSLGFLLTLVTIRLIPSLQTSLGWEWVFAVLTIGPVFGSVAMYLLRQSPEAVKLANGNR